MSKFVKALEQHLLKAGVKILTDTKILEIQHDQQQITAIRTEQNNKQLTIEVSSLIWSVPMFSLANLLNIDVSVLLAGCYE